MDKERSCDAWARMKAEARKLSDFDLARHADVSLANNHQCVECFTVRLCRREGRTREGEVSMNAITKDNIVAAELANGILMTLTAERQNAPERSPDH